MTTTASTSLWDTLDHTPSPRQRNFLRYFTATLVDLVVLGLFAEYWEYVSVSSFTIIVLAAVLFQILLKLTLALEHRVAAFFNARPGGFNKFMRFFTASSGLAYDFCFAGAAFPLASPDCGLVSAACACDTASRLTVTSATAAARHPMAFALADMVDSFAEPCLCAYPSRGY